MAKLSLPSDYVRGLNKAMLACEKYKEITDTNSQKILRTYASNYYSKFESPDPQPLNFIDRTVFIWMSLLASGHPKFIVRPKLNPQYTPFAYVFQIALNQWLERMKFMERTLKRAIFSSFFNEGITKTGTQAADGKRMSGYLAVNSKPYCEVVSRSNYYFDIVARDREQYEFEGDKYYLPTEYARELYPKHAAKIQPDFKLWSEQDPKDITGAKDIPLCELTEQSLFIDLWLPEEKAVITVLPPEKDYEKRLDEISFKGDEAGPYDVLHHKIYPEETIPVPPLWNLMQINTAINKSFHKLRKQIERRKKIAVAEQGHTKEVEAMRNAEDGDICEATSPQLVKDVEMGGVTAEIYDFLGFALNQTAEISGITGIDYRMRAKTATQERMLMSNAMRTVDMMSQNIYTFTSNIGDKLAREFWRNPTMEISAVKRILGSEIPATYLNKGKNFYHVQNNKVEDYGDITDYELQIEMYSMHSLSPDAKFQKMWQIITGWTLPTAPLAAQQGKIANIPAINKDLCDYAGIDTESWYLDELPVGAGGLNPYQPMGGVRSADTRFGSNTGDNANNALQAQKARLGKSTVGV